jgi:iron complex outermembrane receptor protein
MHTGRNDGTQYRSGRPTWAGGVALGIWALVMPTVAVAQDQADQGTEIIVTAQKRAQSIQDVALSITALGAENLAALGQQNISALATQVPSLQVNQYSPTVTVFNIRGVSQVDFADSQESPIAFYSDEVYIGSLGAINGMMFDLDRVEVLRGPQGTLFGRNATGGLIQIISAKPSDDFSAFATATVGSYGQFATEGAITGPIAPSLRARLSFATNYHDGYIKNRIGPDPGQSRFWALRAQVAADVAQGGELTLKVQYMRNDHEHSAGAYSFAAAAPDADGLGRFIGRNEDVFGTCNGCNAVGYSEPDDDPFTGLFNDPNLFDRKYTSVTARYVQDLGGATLTSITDYQKLTKHYTEDSDITPIVSLTYATAQDLRQLSQELRLNGTSGPVVWTAGLYGIKIDTDNSYITDIDFAEISARYDGNLLTRSLAAFGQMEYQVTPQVTLTGGLRYSIDWKRSRFSSTYNGEVVFVFDKDTVGGIAKRKDEDYSGKIEIAYKPSEDLLTYVSINRGTKSGGFSSPAFPPEDPLAVPFAAETLTNYEGGFKLTMPGGASHLNMSAFYYDYKNYQSFTLVPPTTVTIANQDATIKGVEAEFNTRPVRGLYAQLFAAYLDTRVKGVVLPSGRVVDRKMPQAPSLSIGGLVRYDVALGEGKLTVQTDWKYDGAQYFSTFNAPVDRERSRVTGNARIAYSPPSGRWETSAFVNNLTDRAYRIGNADASGFSGHSQQTFAPPRWFGGSLTMRIE